MCVYISPICGSGLDSTPISLLALQTDLMRFEKKKDSRRILAAATSQSGPVPQLTVMKKGAGTAAFPSFLYLGVRC